MACGLAYWAEDMAGVVRTCSGQEQRVHYYFFIELIGDVVESDRGGAGGSFVWCGCCVDVER